MNVIQILVWPLFCEVFQWTLDCLMHVVLHSYTSLCKNKPLSLFVLRHCHTLMVEDGAFSHKMDYVSFKSHYWFKSYGDFAELVNFCLLVELLPWRVRDQRGYPSWLVNSAFFWTTQSSEHFPLIAASKPMLKLYLHLNRAVRRVISSWSISKSSEERVAIVCDNMIFRAALA